MLDNRLASAPYNVIGLTPLSCKATTRPTSMLCFCFSALMAYLQFLDGESLLY